MSNLLERAIIDAKALKEAALKNAEQLVIEKYSEEVKSTIDQLLEQDEMAAMDMDMGMPGLDTGIDDLELNPGEDPATAGLDPASPEEELGPLDPESIVGSLPDAFIGDDDELITIKLASLEAEYEEDDTGVFGGDDKLDDDEISIDITDDNEQIETEDEIELDLEDDLTPDSSAADVGVDITSDIVQEVLADLGIDPTDEDIDLEQLAEKVRVDFEPQKSGWAGTPEPQMREYESMLLAREQDSEVKEENEELRKNVAALQKENKTLTSAAQKLQKQNTKYETAFNTLQEKLETMNVSNAKLLYINQALENASLNERQRKKIVEAISKAETVQEAKIVFDTMSDTVTTTSDVKKESTLNEMVSRRSRLLAAARNEQTTKDANPMYNRMQKLAGIKTRKS